LTTIWPEFDGAAVGDVAGRGGGTGRTGAADFAVAIIVAHCAASTPRYSCEMPRASTRRRDFPRRERSIWTLYTYPSRMSSKVVILP
jgi:hypothetical protein